MSQQTSPLTKQRLQQLIQNQKQNIGDTARNDILKSFRQIKKGKRNNYGTEEKLTNEDILLRFETILRILKTEFNGTDEEKKIFYDVFENMLRTYLSNYFKSDLYKEQYLKIGVNGKPPVFNYGRDYNPLKLIICLSQNKDLQQTFKSNVREKIGQEPNYPIHDGIDDKYFEKYVNTLYPNIKQRFFKQQTKKRTLRSIIPPTITRARLFQVEKGTKQQQQQQQPIDVTQKQISQIKKSVMEERWDFIKWLASKGFYWKDLTPLQRRRVENLVSQKYIITD